ncbi:MAG: ATPase domain-containing protein [bacterium]
MQRIPTGIDNLDLLLEGGIPVSSVIIIGGPKGIGKSAFIHQIVFENATSKKRAFYINTASKPTISVIEEQRGFDFFDPQKIGYSFFYVDVKIGSEKESQAAVSEKIVKLATAIAPAYVVIDNFKDFRLTPTSYYKPWKFIGQLIKKLIALKSTVFLVGEWEWEEIEKEKGINLADGFFYLMDLGSKSRPRMGLYIMKMKKTVFRPGWYPCGLNEEGLSLSLARIEEEEIAGLIQPHKKVKELSWWERFFQFTDH